MHLRYIIFATLAILSSADLYAQGGHRTRDTYQTYTQPHVRDTTVRAMVNLKQDILMYRNEAERRGDQKAVAKLNACLNKLPLLDPEDTQDPDYLKKAEHQLDAIAQTLSHIWSNRPELQCVYPPEK